LYCKNEEEKNMKKGYEEIEKKNNSTLSGNRERSTSITAKIPKSFIRKTGPYLSRVQ